MTELALGAEAVAVTVVAMCWAPRIAAAGSLVKPGGRPSAVVPEPMRQARSRCHGCCRARQKGIPGQRHCLRCQIRSPTSRRPSIITSMRAVRRCRRGRSSWADLRLRKRPLLTGKPEDAFDVIVRQCAEVSPEDRSRLGLRGAAGGTPSARHEWHPRKGTGTRADTEASDA